MPWLGLAATLGWNYRRHLSGRSTICSATRRALPRPIAVALVVGGAVWFVQHIARGYTAH